MKRLSWAALVVGASWAAAAGCHELHACGDRSCEPARAGASSFAGNTSQGGVAADGAGGRDGPAGQGGAEAGASPKPDEGGNGGADNPEAGGPAANAGASGAAEAGNGGEGAVPACTAPFADCDESTFNGCESNVLADVRNCGACRAFCAGACVEGRCEPFEVLFDGMYVPAQGGIAHTSTEVYAFSTVGDTLIRWSAAQGAQTLFTSGDSFREIVSGLERVYLLGGAVDDELSSIPLSGGVVSNEGIPARTAVVSGETLYAVDGAGVPYSRTEFGHETRPLPLPTPSPTDARVWLAAYFSDIALAVEERGEDAVTHTVYYRSGSGEGPWTRLASGDGSPAQLRVGSRGIYIDVILPEYVWWADTWSVEHELREIAFDGTTRVVAALTGLVDFEVVGSRLYLSVELTESTSLLRIVPLHDPRLVVDVQTSASMASLTYSEPFFYFGDRSRNRLARLRDWVE